MALKRCNLCSLLLLFSVVVRLLQQLYRKKPGMTMDASRLAENLPKNRYRDISPCMLYVIVTLDIMLYGFH